MQGKIEPVVAVPGIARQRKRPDLGRIVMEEAAGDDGDAAGGASSGAVSRGQAAGAGLLARRSLQS